MNNKDTSLARYKIQHIKAFEVMCMDEENFLKKFLKELYAQANKRSKDVFDGHVCLAHYTTESTLMKIIKNKEVWLRNTSRMNDSMEIKYGVNALANSLAENGNADNFRSFLMHVFDGDVEYVDRIANIISERGYIDQYITYITCLSEHHMNLDDHEDKYGRLSMWRAYGNPSGVALLFKPEILNLPQDVVSFSPVEYWEQDKITEVVTDKIKFLCNSEDDVKKYVNQGSVYKKMFFNQMIQMMLFAIISLKHPSFAEEREWRLIYNPFISNSLTQAGSVVTEDVEEIRGSLEPIYKVHLSPGMYALNRLLDSIMIGPNNHSPITKKAIESLLKTEGLTAIPVIASNVPLLI